MLRNHKQFVLFNIFGQDKFISIPSIFLLKFVLETIIFVKTEINSSKEKPVIEIIFVSVLYSFLYSNYGPD